MISAIIMASGFSNRMGQNKLLMKYENTYIIQKVLDIIKKCEFKDVVVVSQYDEILKISKTYEFKSILNENANIGQSESIKLGVINTKDSNGFMFFVGDQPLMNENDIKKLIKVFNENKDYIVIPTYNGKNGNPVIFPEILRQRLLSLENDEKGKVVIKDYDKVKYIEVSEETLIDIDTKQDYDKLVKMYSV